MENMVSLQRLENTYKGKKVFLTGHTGFKGAWMLRTLSLLGADILGYALEPKTSNDLFCLIEGEQLCKSVIADVRDKKRLQSEIAAFQPDFIFHLAAQPLVRVSYEIPAETFEVNVIGTANVLDGVKLLQKKCSVVLITTDKVYYNNESLIPYRENDRLGGHDPYSASKACAEMLIDSYRNCFFNTKDYDSHLKGIAVARAGNVIGGGDWAKDRLIPDVVRSLQSDSEIVIRNQSSIRPWQHVIEPLFGYLELGVKLLIDPIQFGQAFNFGPNKFDNLTVEEVVTEAIKYWESGSYRIQQSIENYHEASLLKLDISKALLHLNWKPVFDSSTSIERTISWYKKFYSGISVLELMNSDIEFYLEKSNE